MPMISEAACGMRAYIFNGTILDKRTSQPIKDAIIFTFLGEQEHTYSNGYTTNYPDFARSNDTGNFISSSYYHTFVSYNANGHDCTATPSIVEFVVTAVGYLSSRKQIKIKPHDASSEDVKIILQEPIKLTASQK